MLFDRKHKKKIQIVWGIVVILVIVSMIALYLPSLFR